MTWTVLDFSVTVSTSSPYTVKIEHNFTTIYQGFALTDPAHIFWEKRDRSLFPTGYVSSLAQHIGVKFTAYLGGSASLPKETNPTFPKNQLSAGAAAGISIGAVVAALLLFGVAIFYIMKKRTESRSPIHTSTTPEMEDQDQQLSNRKWFLGGRWRSEAVQMIDSTNWIQKVFMWYRGPRRSCMVRKYNVLENRREDMNGVCEELGRLGWYLFVIVRDEPHGSFQCRVTPIF